MSRRNKRTRPQQGIIPRTSGDRGVFTSDGYSIPDARIGVPGANLLANSRYSNNYVTRNKDFLTTLYRSSWLVKRIIDTPAEDMTKKWYKINSEILPERIDQLHKLEMRHSIKKELTDAIKWARLYGGSAAIIIVKGQEDMMGEPLDMDMVVPGSFKGLLVLDNATGIQPGTTLVDDIDDPDYGLPETYAITTDTMTGGMVEVHHTRVLRFVGRELPPDDSAMENYWGASEIEHVLSELNKRDATSANIAQLIFQANLKVMKMQDLGEVLAMTSPKHRDKMLESIAYQNYIATSFGTLLMGAEDGYETHPYSFSGISEVYQQFKMDIAGAAEMPATKLFGQSPDGMNATGESDLINYNDTIAQKQENMLRGPLERLLPVMCMSLWGEVPPDMEIAFESVTTLSEKQKAEIATQQAGYVSSLFTSGVISQKTALTELRNAGTSIGVWDSITDEDIKNADDTTEPDEMSVSGLLGIPEEPAEPAEPTDTPFGGR